MSWFVFVYRVLFFLYFVLYESQGKITSPPDGTNITILAGGSGRIVWKFHNDIYTVAARIWSFTSTDGLRTGSLGAIPLNLDPVMRPGILPGITIKKPATLVLNNVNQSYDGIYKFTLASFRSFSSDVRVFIAKKPTVTLNCSASVTLNEDDDFICECRGLGGNPPANVTWYKDGNQMQGKTGTKEQLLTLINVDETDSGTYKCVSKSYPDPLYRDEKSIKINVRFRPKDTSIQLNPNPAILGQSFTITCSFRGFPEPSYKIFFNGNHLIDAKTHTINNVQKSHAGVYECNAKNGLQNYKDSKILKITEKPTVTIDGPSRITVDEGRNVISLCKSEGGNPPASIRWYKDGRPIGNPSSRENRLTLTNVAEKDSGKYKCVARSHSLTDEKSIEVIVNLNYKPKDTKIDIEPLKVDVHGQVILTCSSTGFPDPGSP